MNIELKIDEIYKETKIIICTDKMTDEISELVSKISAVETITIKGYKDDKMYILEQGLIESVYAENGKVYARFKNEVYELKNRLYELENQLSKKDFVRISNSEIINIMKVENIDFKLLGTIEFNFKSGNKAYVSRRYIKKIKEFLEI